MFTPVAYDWVEFIVVREGTCLLRHRDEGRYDWAKPGDVLFLLPNIPCGLEPEGQTTLTRLFASTEVMVACIKFSNPKQRLNEMTAPLFACEEYPEASQLVSVDPEGQPDLFANLDALVRLTRERRLLVRWIEATRYFFGALMWFGPKLKTRHDWEIDDPVRLEDRPTQACFYRFRPLSQTVRQARNLIDAHFTDYLTSEELARAVSMSESALRKRFTQEMGKTPRAYMLSLRVQQMARLLLITDDTIEAIAHQVGWADRGNAVDVFTAAAGISPTEFRHRFRTRRTTDDEAIPVQDEANLLTFAG